MRTVSCGFAMIEVVMATAIIAGLTVGALTLVASTAAQKANAANIARGQMLCRTLAEEIATRPVADWSDGSGLNIKVQLAGITLQVTGSDAKAVTITAGSGNRSTFDTIDDYKNFSESPPKDEDGNILPGYTGWTRSVRIASATLDSPDTVDAIESGLRRVTVSTSYAGKVVATTTFLRSSEWERVQP